MPDVAVRAPTVVVSGRRPVALVAALAAILVLAFAQPAWATNVSGSISSNTTWTTAGSPYILTGNVTVNSGVTLTIEPGVVVKLNSQLRSLTVNGTLSAVGSSFSPIVFTSIQDDTVGGDSNGDGSASQPEPGQWYTISFSSSSGLSELEFIEARYGGYGSSATNYGAISIGSVALTIENATIRDSQRSGIKVAAGGDLTLRRSTVARGENGLSVNMGVVSVEHSTVLENSEDGIWFNLTSSYAGDASSVTDSDVKRNDDNGVELLVDRNLTTTKWPHGTGNNIFNNESDKQLKLSGYHPASTPQYVVDWADNFWGTDVYFWYAPSLCLGTAPNSEGHLAYEWSDPEPGPGGVNTPPDGPLSYNTYYAGSGSNIAGCAYDRIPVGPEDYSPTYIMTAGRVSFSEAVSDNAPELRYDAQETYQADSASTITVNYTETYTNQLLDGSENVIASADPSAAGDALSLSYLGAFYPDETEAQAEDYLDEANNYAEDAQRLHAISGYADRAYARVHQEADGQIVIQYWLFYYYNPKTFVGVGVHEGDWEMIQVHLDAAGNPVQASYAQHGGGETCDWGDVETTAGGGPVVYVGEGSHASYFTAGAHELYPFTYDYANGDGEVVTPTVTHIAFDAPWILWPGTWGGSGSSPDGPAHHGSQWSDPLGWAAGGAGCTASLMQASGAKPVRPGLPKVRAWQRGNRAVIDYRFGAWPKDRTRRPWQLLTTVDARGDLYPPLSRRSRITERHGRVSQPIGFGRGPFRLLISVRAENGSRSRTMSVPILQQ